MTGSKKRIIANMKILFIGRYNESEILNGPEKVAKRIFSKSTNEFETAFITYFFNGKESSIYKKLFGEELFNGPGEHKIYRLGIFKIIPFMFKYKPDITHLITYERFSLASLIYKKYSNSKMYYNVHGIAAYENANNSKANFFLKLKDKYCERKYFRNSDKLFFLSQDSIELSGKYYPSGRSKLLVIPNGIDKIFNQLGANKRFDNSRLKMVFIGGQNRKEKGFEFLINALSTLPFRFDLFIIGDASYYSIYNSIKFDLTFIDTMETNALAEFYRDKDIFISASSYEQFSIAAAEAMAAGLVPVVTEETGMSSYINNYKNGFKIKYGDIEGLKKILLLLNEDRNKLKEVSNEAANIYDLLSWELVFEKYKTLYY